MDIQKIITEALEALQNNEDLRKLFDVDPVKALENILHIDLPDEKINAVIEAIKAKLTLDDAKEIAGKLFSGLGNLFGRR